MNAKTIAGPSAGREAIPRLTYGQLFGRFLRFGLLAWGGPVAQIAMLRRELVEEEGWIASERFNKLLAVMQVLPGPEAHELCVHLGVRAKGRLGGVLAGLGFMLPGFVLILALSWLYTRVNVMSASLAAAFLGMQAAVLALIVRAVQRIGQHVLLDAYLWAIAVASAVAAAGEVPFWITLPAAGVVSALLALNRRVLAVVATAAAIGVAAALRLGDRSVAVAVAVVAEDVSPLLLFASGLKAGLLTFGGAYTAIPFIRNDAVGRGWMTDGQFLDGLALSGVLPAPLIIFATFVGYIAGGFSGAIAMTAGVFLPAFAFSLIFYDRLETVLDVKQLHAFLDGVAAGVVGMIAATTLDLGLITASRVPSLAVASAIFGTALTVLYVWKNKLDIVVVMAAAGMAGWLGFR